jgi:hypothetical protein
MPVDNLAFHIGQEHSAFRTDFDNSDIHWIYNKMVYGADGGIKFLPVLGAGK